MTRPHCFACLDLEPSVSKLLTLSLRFGSHAVTFKSTRYSLATLHYICIRHMWASELKLASIASEYALFTFYFTFWNNLFGSFLSIRLSLVVGFDSMNFSRVVGPVGRTLAFSAMEMGYWSLFLFPFEAGSMESTRATLVLPFHSLSQPCVLQCICIKWWQHVCGASHICFRSNGVKEAWNMSTLKARNINSHLNVQMNV